MLLQYSRNTKIILLGVVIILTLIFLHFIKVLRPFENVFVGATRPALAAVYKVSNVIGSNYLNFKNRNDLMNENVGLRAELTKLMSEKSACLVEKEENDYLRKQLNFTETAGADTVIASVVGRDSDTGQNILVIDRGADQGIEPGQAVVADDGVFIGKIMKANRNDAFVLILNDDRSKTAVKIQNAAKTMGLAQGEYGLGIRMQLIPQTETIKEGDIVVTSGLEQKVPANLLVGRVERVSTSPEELFQEASIKSTVDFAKVTMVTVIKQKNAD